MDVDEIKLKYAMDARTLEERIARARELRNKYIDNGQVKKFGRISRYLNAANEKRNNISKALTSAIPTKAGDYNLAVWKGIRLLKTVPTKVLTESVNRKLANMVDKDWTEAVVHDKGNYKILAQYKKNIFG